jgi:hypothetical protein
MRKYVLNAFFFDDSSNYNDCTMSKWSKIMFCHGSKNIFFLTKFYDIVGTNLNRSLNFDLCLCYTARNRNVWFIFEWVNGEVLK